MTSLVRCYTRRPRHGKTRRDWYAANHHKYVEPVPKHATPYDPDKNAFHDAINPPPAGPNPALIPVAS